MMMAVGATIKKGHVLLASKRFARSIFPKSIAATRVYRDRVALDSRGRSSIALSSAARGFVYTHTHSQQSARVVRSDWIRSAKINRQSAGRRRRRRARLKQTLRARGRPPELADSRVRHYTRACFLHCYRGVVGAGSSDGTEQTRLVVVGCCFQ